MKKLVFALILLSAGLCNAEVPWEYGDNEVGGVVPYARFTILPCVPTVPPDPDGFYSVPGGGRYAIPVRCGNCGECWSGTDMAGCCYMISESWENMQNRGDQ